MDNAARLGAGAHTYQSDTGWARPPAGVGWREIAGVAIGGDGRVYVFARGDHPVIVFEPDGTFVTSWGEGIFANPHAITPGPDGTMYATDHFGHVVRQLSADGEVLMTIGEPGAPSGPHSGRPFNMPTDVAVDPATGDLLITDGYRNSAVHRFSAQGEHILSWGGPGVDPGEFSIPHNVAVDADGFVYVADRENHRIQVFDGRGEFQDQFNNVHRPCTLRFGPDGLLYVGELGFGMTVNRDVPNIGPRISVLNRFGRRVAKVGHLGFGTGPGQMIAPHAIAIDDRGDIYLGEVAATAGRGWLDDQDGLPSLRKLVRVAD